MNLRKIEGIGSIYAETLTSVGIRSAEALLVAAASRPGRRELSMKTGLSEALILDWVNRADLMRVRGVGEEYSDLLEAAGVDSVRELALRRPDNLHETIVKVNTHKRLVRRVPSLGEVERWVDKAKSLDPLVTH